MLWYQRRMCLECVCHMCDACPFLEKYGVAGGSRLPCCGCPSTKRAQGSTATSGRRRAKAGRRAGDDACRPRDVSGVYLGAASHQSSVRVATQHNDIGGTPTLQQIDGILWKQSATVGRPVPLRGENNALLSPTKRRQRDFPTREVVKCRGGRGLRHPCHDRSPSTDRTIWAEQGRSDPKNKHGGYHACTPKLLPENASVRRIVGPCETDTLLRDFQTETQRGGRQAQYNTGRDGSEGNTTQRK